MHLSEHERVLRDVLKDPNASSDAKVKAALAIDRMKTRRKLAKRKADEAAGIVRGPQFGTEDDVFLARVEIAGCGVPTSRHASRRARAAAQIIWNAVGDNVAEVPAEGEHAEMIQQWNDFVQEMHNRGL